MGGMMTTYCLDLLHRAYLWLGARGAVAIALYAFACVGLAVIVGSLMREGRGRG